MRDPVTRTEPRALVVSSADKAEVTLRLYAAEAADAPIAIVLPAMGIDARYYARFAETLSALGVETAVGDLRGSGTSSVRASRACDFGYRQLAHVDLPAWVAALRAERGSRPVFLVGHSLGGQVALLSAASGLAPIAGVALVATSSPYFRSFAFPRSTSVLAQTQLAFCIAEALGYFPGHRLGFGGREARGLIREWARVARSGRYRLKGSGVDAEQQLAALSLPVLSITLAGDSIAPRTAVEALLSKLQQVRLERWHYDPAQHALPPTDHNRWPKQPEAIALRIAAWAKAQSASALDTAQVAYAG